jgi:hypothetical protein
MRLTLELNFPGILGGYIQQGHGLEFGADWRGGVSGQDNGHKP